MYCQLLTLTLLSSLILPPQLLLQVTKTVFKPQNWDYQNCYVFVSFFIQNSIKIHELLCSIRTCATCTAALIGIVTGNDGDTTPTSALGTDAAGCATITYTCERNPVVATDVVLITYYSDSRNPTDVGTENGVGTANVVMNCVNGVWVKDGIEINDIECQIIT
ncbi:hypothetical protein CAEBREN_17705 [Caenorhabditis brenneri]|uniref:C6 domain-containing protein n=1 Tax=Caenorhabditis brenneri TaxID=135651 RepID=G0MI00_CAEBE|nr:hypothetical protein CAEBREN_17705 [Caenorhabditis brenneri]